MAKQTNSENHDWAFNLADTSRGIQRKLAEGITTRIFPGQNVMLSVVTLEPNSSGIIHSHPEEQWGMLLDGNCVRLQADEEVQMYKGDFWYTPGGVEHMFALAAQGQLFWIFLARQEKSIDVLARVSGRFHLAVQSPLHRHVAKCQKIQLSSLQCFCEVLRHQD